MDNEEFVIQIQQALIEDIKQKEDGIDKISKLMENIPVLPFEEMAPLIRIPLWGS